MCARVSCHVCCAALCAHSTLRSCPGPGPTLLRLSRAVSRDYRLGVLVRPSLAVTIRSNVHARRSATVVGAAGQRVFSAFFEFLYTYWLFSLAAFIVETILFN